MNERVKARSCTFAELLRDCFANFKDNVFQFRLRIACERATELHTCFLDAGHRARFYEGVSYMRKKDPKFIARRLVISASEDIGLANPNALLLANACFDTIHKIGWPEGRIPLAETTIYLATSPKSNSAYNAINNALSIVERTGNLPVPLHLRNAPTKLMKELNYGAEYKYSHDYPNHFVNQEYLPSELKNTKFWESQINQHEIKMQDYINKLWKK